MTADRNDPANQEFASPACGLHEADDLYRGYAPRDEIAAFLNLLLEAERAGARVAMASARQSGNGAQADLLVKVGHDEGRWCAMLTKWLRALRAEPSRKVGDFHDKAMALPVGAERLAFLNRGQSWVVRRLAEMLPRIKDDGLHADLKAMLLAHRENIEATETLLTEGK